MAANQTPLSQQDAATTLPPIYTDHPMNLIPTPFHTTGRTATDAFTREASNMALSHNVLIRGFNSIYQTAPRLFPAVDSGGGTAASPGPLSKLSEAEIKSLRADFVSYCLAWARLVDEHHRLEEEGIFPRVEAIVGEKDVMGREEEEHVAIHTGITTFRTYLSSLPTPSSLSSPTLLSTLDAFSPAFHAHLTSEPLTLAALSRYGPAFAAANKTLVEVSLEEGKKTMGSLDFVANVLPAFLLNMEFEEFEDGYWKDKWPDLHGGLRWALFNVVPLWNRGWWRFASCDAQGRMKRLAV